MGSSRPEFDVFLAVCERKTMRRPSSDTADAVELSAVGPSEASEAADVGLLDSEPTERAARPAAGHRSANVRCAVLARSRIHPLVVVGLVAGLVIVVALLRISGALSGATGNQAADDCARGSDAVWVDTGDAYAWKAVAYSPEMVAEHCASELAALDRLHADVTSDNVLEFAQEIDDRLATLTATFSFLSEVDPSEDVRNACSECYRDAAAKSSELGLSRTLYDAFAAIEGVELPCPDDTRYVSKSLRSFRRQGVNMDAAEQGRLRALDANITAVGEDYESNVINDVREVTVQLPAEQNMLAGLPQDFIDSHTSDDGSSVTFTTDYPDYFPVMTYAESTDLRKRLNFQFMNRGYPANVALLDELLSLRFQYATILGYSDWAEYRQDTMMAETPTVVRDFLTDVAQLAKPRADEELARVLPLVGTEATTLHSWDASFFMNKARNEFYGVDSSEVRQYFTYQKAKSGVLELASRLFQLRFEEMLDADKWSADVEVFDVYSLDPDVSNTGFPPAATAATREERADASQGVLIGRIYLDMHPRAGKYKHAASFPMVSGLHGHHLTQTALATNFPKTGPMEHSQVTTFLHEFGHLLHTIIGGVGQRYTMFSGVETEWDFVEAPSQMLEEWAWRADVLQTFATNQAGEVIPTSLVEKMVEASDFGVGMGTRQQVFYAFISLVYYNRDPAGLNTTNTIVELQGELSPYPYFEGTHFNCNFGHLVGYSSAYYTYQWSLAIAKDMYTRFETGNEAAVATSYSHKILNPGGRQDATDLLQSFLGRPYNLDAYRAWLAPPSQ